MGIIQLNFVASVCMSSPRKLWELLDCKVFERNIIRKRQAEGIAKAKERGVYKNRKRKPVIDRDEVRNLKAEGLSTYKIADQMDVVYNLMDDTNTATLKMEGSKETGTFWDVSSTCRERGATTPFY